MIYIRRQFVSATGASSAGVESEWPCGCGCSSWQASMSSIPMHSPCRLLLSGGLARAMGPQQQPDPGLYCWLWAAAQEKDLRLPDSRQTWGCTAAPQDAPQPQTHPECTHTCAHTHPGMHANTHMHVYTQAHIHAHAHAQAHIHMHTCAINVHISLMHI